MDDMINTLLNFEKWANHRVLTSLKNLKQVNPRALQLMAHLLTAEKIWLLRLQGEDTVGTDKAPELTLEKCELMARENQDGLFQVLANLDSEGLDVMVDYKNLSGKEFSTSVWDILTHVVIHGAYHRGQIALALRSGGSEPPNTDFITYVRETG
jgi:uncharacterized damage-inducible protein DinB